MSDPDSSLLQLATTGLYGVDTQQTEALETEQAPAVQVRVMML